MLPILVLGMASMAKPLGARDHKILVRTLPCRWPTRLCAPRTVVRLPAWRRLWYMNSFLSLQSVPSRCIFSYTLQVLNCTKSGEPDFVDQQIQATQSRRWRHRLVCIPSSASSIDCPFNPYDYRGKYLPWSLLTWSLLTWTKIVCVMWIRSLWCPQKDIPVQPTRYSRSLSWSGRKCSPSCGHLVQQHSHAQGMADCDNSWHDSPKRWP